MSTNNASANEPTSSIRKEMIFHPKTLEAFKGFLGYIIDAQIKKSRIMSESSMLDVKRGVLYSGYPDGGRNPSFWDVSKKEEKLPVSAIYGAVNELHKMRTSKNFGYIPLIDRLCFEFINGFENTEAAMQAMDKFIERTVVYDLLHSGGHDTTLFFSWVLVEAKTCLAFFNIVDEKLESQLLLSGLNNPFNHFDLEHFLLLIKGHFEQSSICKEYEEIHPEFMELTRRFAVRRRDLTNRFRNREYLDEFTIENVRKILVEDVEV